MLCGRCRIPLRVTQELYDAIARVVVCDGECPDCGWSYVYQRAASIPELSLAHHAVIYREESSTSPKGFTVFKPKVALYLKGVSPTTENVDGETRKRVSLEFFVQPFTREMAADLEVAGNLFSMTTGDPIDDIVRCELAINVPLQRMGLAMAPDTVDSVIIENVNVAPTIKVRRNKEGPILAATLHVDFPYPSPDDLLYLFNGYLSQHFVTFETMQGNLGLSDGDAAPKAKKRKKGNEPAADGPSESSDMPSGQPAQPSA